MRLYILLCLSLGFCIYSQAQINIITPKKADSLATATQRDVLNHFFQLGLEKLTGPDKEIKFTSNPYAVMAKLDSGLQLSNEYYRLRNLRKLNFGVSVKLDSSYKFNGFSSSIKYALINKRDETVSWAFVRSFLSNEEIQSFFQINNALVGKISNFASNREQQIKLIDQANEFTQGKLPYNKLDQQLQVAVKQVLREQGLNNIREIIVNDPKFNPKVFVDSIYNTLKEKLNNKLLWTVSISDTTYNDRFQFANVVFSTDIVKGIDDMRAADIELNINANINYSDDTVTLARDLKRSVFTFEPGLNFVAKTKSNLKSILEFKLAGGYYHVLTGLYNNEDRNRITLNGTLRIRIYNEIWIPIEIRYEPKTGNVFGFLNVRANFSSLRGLLKR